MLEEETWTLLEWIGIFASLVIPFTAGAAVSALLMRSRETDDEIQRQVHLSRRLSPTTTHETEQQEVPEKRLPTGDLREEQRNA